ncbi:MAG: energy-coupling factor transport system ATP-binding protein [Clostridia bacterium]|jgi:energy-coupling factor transport system ATP-binding protein|uniref:Putative ABC transporter, ATP-binding protein n=1 Tax=Thermacetogenium phaeum TaxID=85874 RepID=A0A124FKE2_9THEO|nr:MAG: Putative ABC transporter, ATP-binding protein [Thermacetogenium phaeum]MDK2880525.1 energy-coupling factor transport system ATP-binding protein [Clostridia bacterium]
MAEPVVDVRGLTFTYDGSTSPALEGINLKVYPGEFLAITGPSGCGKSTLALCLAGFIPHAYGGKMEGVVRIQGRDTRDYPAGGLSGIVGLVQQDPDAQLCTLTVSDEVAFGPENLRIPPEEIRERVHFALQAVGALDLKDRKVHTLSGGEKQRVAIASVLAMTPVLLILDEPTANLDPSCTREVLRTMEKLREEQGISIIVIEHRLERLVPISDRLLLMEKGRIVEESTDRKLHRRYLPAAGWTDSGTDLRQGEPAGLEKKGEKLPLLSVENLQAGYEGREVLKGISFCAYPGETLAIMGDNGSGKTTLLLALLGVLKPGEGRIFLNGKDITGMRVARRARDLGLVFQNPNHQIFENTVFKEAVLPSLFLSKEAPREIEQKVERLLEEFGLRRFRDNNPFALSLGEKKRLTLVSVLAYSPGVLILDEPLVGQDGDRLKLLISALEEHRAQGGVTLMVCHEPAVVVACCQRVLFLSEGKLIVDAPVKDALLRLAELGREEYLPSGYRLTSAGERG